jgi:hypothetical protein
VKTKHYRKEPFLHEKHNTGHEISTILVLFALKHGVSRASRKYNKARSYIYFWLSRYNGAIESLASHSRKPHSHPNHIPRKKLTFCAVYGAETPILAFVSFGAECENMDIPVAL